MLYTKVKLNDQVELKVELFDDEIFSDCGDCGKTMEVDPVYIIGIWNSGGDFPGTTFYCAECTKKKRANPC